MDADYFRLIYDYHFWARDRVLSAASGMSEAEYAKPNGFTYGSLRGILTHTLSAEGSYLARWQGESPPAPATEETLPTVESLAERWRQQEGRLRSYLQALTDADLDRVLVTQRRAGGEFSRRLGMDLAQISIHGMQHRSEAAEALTIVGRSPGGLDLSLYLQETGMQ